MENKSEKLDRWRDFFRTAHSDIFEVIDSAIVVAASDFPDQFQLRRDQITEKLYTCRLNRCSGCDRLDVSARNEEEEDEGFNTGAFFAKEGKDSKATRTNDREELNSQNWDGNKSYDEAEALTDQIEEETQLLGEILRIKDILQNKYESEGALFESLRRLQLMGLSVEILKATEIGKAVSVLRKNGSKEISQLARTLIDGWKILVDEWVNATAALSAADGTPESVNPSVVDEEEGLPSPPLDEGALFATQTTSVELSQFFDGMDEDGNPRNGGDCKNHRKNERKPVSEASDRKRKQQTFHESNLPKKNEILLSKQVVDKKTKPSNSVSKATLLEDDKKPMNGQGNKREMPPKQTKPSNSNLKAPNALSESKNLVIKQEAAGRQTGLLKNNFRREHEANGETNVLQQADVLRKMPPSVQQDISVHADDLVRLKLEATGRNLQERYQQLQNAKKQRTIQVMELHDLPKQGNASKSSHFKPAAQRHHWANGRR